MIPLYDTARSRTFPLVNWIIILLNGLIFYYELRLGDTSLEHFIRIWGLSAPTLLARPETAWPTVFTSMFIHGGWFHILSNMWVLFIFGDNVEGRLGHFRYLLFYLLSGMAAAALQTVLLSRSGMPMVGASGAIAGVLGAYLVLFPRARVASLVPILFIFTIIELPAIIFLAFWFISQLFSGLGVLHGGAGSGIAWWAHVGGFLFGMAAGLAMAPRRRQPQVYGS